MTRGRGQSSRDRVAELGERKACEHLQSLGFRVVERNFENRLGELDVVAYEGDTLVFCEVKTRRTTSFGRPYEAVTVAKQRRIRRLAESYLALRKPTYREIRFDVLSVMLSGARAEVSHIRNAF